MALSKEEKILLYCSTTADFKDCFIVGKSRMWSRNRRESQWYRNDRLLFLAFCYSLYPDIYNLSHLGAVHGNMKIGHVANRKAIDLGNNITFQ